MCLVLWLHQSQKYFHGSRGVKKKKKNSTECIWFQPDSCNKATFHPPLFSASNRILSGGETASYQGYLTESLQFAWVEVIEEVEEASFHLSHIWDICEEGVLQGGRLDYFTGPRWLGGPGLLPVGSDRKKNKITLQLFIFVNIWQHLKKQAKQKQHPVEPNLYPAVSSNAGETQRCLSELFYCWSWRKTWCIKPFLSYFECETPLSLNIHMLSAPQSGAVLVGH